MLTLVRSSEYVKFWWLPHTGRVQIFRYTPTSKPSNESRVNVWFDRRSWNKVALPTMLTVGSLWPQSIPAINRFVGLAYLKRPRVVKRSHRAFQCANARQASRGRVCTACRTSSRGSERAATHHRLATIPCELRPRDTPCVRGRFPT